MDVNFKGAFFLTQAFVRKLVAAKEARPRHQHLFRA
jgi:NAD(P)-dependent dehydrogenase (short-subunit alcohol dehydrogenase family)